MRFKKKSKHCCFIYCVHICIVAVIGILMFFLISCKSPTSPDGEGEADIIVSNEYGDTVDIYMDGIFKFSIRHKNSIEIDNVSLEEHQLEAKQVNTDILIDSETIDVQEKIDYTWVVEDPPDINVINEYGKALKIYMDGNYQFDLAHTENRWILDVSYGEHLLQAIRVSDEQAVASITINVDENEDYSWTVQAVSLKF